MYLLATAWDPHYNVDHRGSEHLNAGKTLDINVFEAHVTCYFEHAHFL